MQPEDGEHEPLLGYIALEQSGVAVDMIGHGLLPVGYMDAKGLPWARRSPTERKHASRLATNSLGPPGPPVEKCVFRQPSAVTGSIILRTSVTTVAGNPLRSACSWMSASSSAR